MDAITSRRPGAPSQPPFAFEDVLGNDADSASRRPLGSRFSHRSAKAAWCQLPQLERSVIALKRGEDRLNAIERQIGHTDARRLRRGTLNDCALAFKHALIAGRGEIGCAERAQSSAQYLDPTVRRVCRSRDFEACEQTLHQADVFEGFMAFVQTSRTMDSGFRDPAHFAWTTMSASSMRGADSPGVVAAAPRVHLDALCWVAMETAERRNNHNRPAERPKHRKNWLFAGSMEGARRAALLYSLV